MIGLREHHETILHIEISRLQGNRLGLIFFVFVFLFHKLKTLARDPEQGL
jgi:hypothetical protein